MNLEERLINWARAQSCGGGDGGRDSLVASIYFPGVSGRSVSSTLDLADANRVEVAMRTLMPLDRRLLQMHYVWHKPPFVICRRLGLKVRPATVFDLALAHARRSLGEKLLEPKREFVSMQSIIDRLQSEPLAETK
ncbi:hypothetical protein SB778_27095 [Paraburkholderia sp. SIMBA_050]|nr:MULTISPECIES: hypothetical protein [Paraburkholderia]AXE91691.1 hypothetical protein CUJ90_04350 [Paraburkholderia terricola]MDR6445581.1 hypothetical protein [Paraburkholderia terricola]